MNINFASTRAKWLGVTLIAASLTLNGCGGGGSGPGISPTPTPTGSNGSCSRTYTPNYRTDPLMDRNNPLLHWAAFPLRVYFKTDGAYSTARQALAVRGFNHWVKSTGSDGATYQVVNSASKANVVVDFYLFTGGAGDRLGYTEFDYDAATNIITTVKRPVQIHIGISGDNNNDLITASHEFGHALGINGHSANPSDLMYFEGNEQAGGGISTRDLNTILTAYCGDFNKNSNARIAPQTGDIKSVIIE